MKAPNRYDNLAEVINNAAMLTNMVGRSLGLCSNRNRQLAESMDVGAALSTGYLTVL